MISLNYGDNQRFRFRLDDINLIGQVDAKLPLRHSTYSLNDSAPIHFYVEPNPASARGKYLGAPTPSVLRLLGRPGAFNVEIPISHPALLQGCNNVRIQIEDGEARTACLNAQFAWNPSPVPLPLTLDDLSGYTHIQDIGQVVDGDFELDRTANVIRSKEPVAPDSLLVLGSPSESQEATYDAKFRTDGGAGCFLGLSDFFAGHKEQSPGLGIKPGYATAGLATITPQGWAQAWIANADLLMDKDWAWTINTRYPPKYTLRPGVTYRVRHQIFIKDGVNIARYRVWNKGDPEPVEWLCVETNAHLDRRLQKISKASFGLFQWGGLPTEWSNLCVRPLSVDTAPFKLKAKKYYIMGSWFQVQRAVARVNRRTKVLAHQILSGKP